MNTNEKKIEDLKAEDAKIKRELDDPESYAAQNKFYAAVLRRQRTEIKNEIRSLK
jgi:hypothetical protein